jgi:hypothetical protein
MVAVAGFTGAAAGALALSAAAAGGGSGSPFFSAGFARVKVRSLERVTRDTLTASRIRMR